MSTFGSIFGCTVSSKTVFACHSSWSQAACVMSLNTDLWGQQTGKKCRKKKGYRSQNCQNLISLFYYEVAAVWLAAIVGFFLLWLLLQISPPSYWDIFSLLGKQVEKLKILNNFFICNISSTGKWELILQIHFTVSFSSSNCLQLWLYLPVSLYCSCSLSVLWGGAIFVRSIYPIVAQQNSYTKNSALNCCFHWHAHKHASTCLKLYFFKKDHAFISS